MTAFPDTSFLCSIYREQIHSAKADSFLSSANGPIPVSSLLLLEFRQSTRLQARLFSQGRNKGFPEAEGRRMLEDLAGDVPPLDQGARGLGAAQELARKGVPPHLIDLADWDKALATSAPGQSGQPGSPHFADLAPLWANGEYFPLAYSRKMVESVTKNRLVLTPGK